MFLENTVNVNEQFGWIEVICGSMFSGKTEELIRRLKRAKIAKQKVKLEASGGISDVNSLLEIAKTGVDFISMGDLTKNIQAIDMSLLLD